MIVNKKRQVKKLSAMLQVHFYLAAAVCTLVQLVACEQRCSNARHRPLSFTVVNKRNSTCHWMPEVQMDAGADDPLLNGGWQVRISLPKASIRGYGQVVEVMATKKFNEFAAASNELCGATTTSSILSLINANQKNIEKPDQTTTPVPFAVDTGAGTTLDEPLPTATTTSKKMEILFTPSTSTSKPSSITAKTSATPQILTTPASSKTFTTSKMTTTIPVPTTTFKDSSGTSKQITNTLNSEGPALASSSSTTLYPSTKKEEVLFTTPTAVSKSSTAKITEAAPASQVSTLGKTETLLTMQATISKSSPTATTVSDKPSTTAPVTVATTTAALTSVTKVQTSKKTDNIFTTPSTIAESSPSTTSGASKITITAETTPSTEVPTSKKANVFIDLPKVSTPTQTSPSPKATTQPKFSTDHTKWSTITDTASTSTMTPSILMEEVSPLTKGKGSSSTEMPTSSLQPEIDGNDADKIDDSDLGEKGDEYYEITDLDIDARGREDDNDKEEDYAFDYSLNLGVKPE